MRARYSRHSGYSISRQSGRKPALRSTAQTLKFGPTSAKYLGLAVLAVLAMVMITQSSGSTTAGYEQSSLRKDISKVDQDIERLRLEAKRAQSVQEIQNTTLKDGMVPMEKAQYIEKGEVAGVSTSAPTTTPATNQ